MTSERRRWNISTTLTFFALIVLTAAVYWPGLSGPLLLDDHANLDPLQALENGSATWASTILGNHSGHMGRSISMLSFGLNVTASGFSVWAFKYTNLMLHLLSGSLVFWIGGRLFRQVGIQRPWPAALFVCALWMLAPLYVSTVLYVIQRMAQLSTLFMLAGLLCYIVGRQNEVTRSRWSSALLCSTFALWTPLAVLSKENGALLPLLALIVEISFFRFAGTKSTRTLLGTLYCFFLVIPAVVASVWLAINPEFVTGGYAFRDFTLSERLMTEPRALLSYTTALLIPSGPSLGLFHDDYPISTGLLNPWTTVPALLFWVVLTGWWLLTGCRTTRSFLFGPVFFVAGHGLESGIFSLELYFEHRNYLPGFGIFFTIVLGAGKLLPSIPNKRTFAAGMVAVTLLFGLATWQRAMNWTTWELIVRTNAIQHSESSRLHTELASLEINAGNMSKASAHLEQAVKLSPKSESGALLHRMLGHCITGTRSKPMQAEELPPYRASAYALTALDQFTKYVVERGCDYAVVREGTRLVQHWLRTAPTPRTIPNLWKIRFDLAKLLWHLGEPDEALGQLELADRAAPKRLEPQLLATGYYLEMGRLEQASAGVASLQRRDDGSRTDFTQVIAVYERKLALAFNNDSRAKVSK